MQGWWGHGKWPDWLARSVESRILIDVEMKYLPSYQWAKKVTAVTNFWPPNVNEGSLQGLTLLSCGAGEDS